ncbi:MAG: hypothetical protein MUF27_09435 [Acidobacteria bacterium]|nr:hypothetical protein [Acidobacteriota bacterium]
MALPAALPTVPHVVVQIGGQRFRVARHLAPLYPLADRIQMAYGQKLQAGLEAGLPAEEAHARALAESRAEDPEGARAEDLIEAHHNETFHARYATPASRKELLAHVAELRRRWSEPGPAVKARPSPLRLVVGSARTRGSARARRRASRASSPPAPEPDEPAPRVAILSRRRP